MRWLRRLRSLLRKIAAWAAEPEWEVCKTCGRPLADRMPDEAIWRHHFRMTGVRDHSVDACDGEHNPVVVKCKYDGYPPDGREDW